MLRRYYDWMLRLANHKHALLWLAVLSFTESSFFPIPPDPLLILLVLATPRRAWLIAAITTVSSVVGGWLGYAIGFYLFPPLGQPIIALFHMEQGFADLQAWFAVNGGWAILIKGLLPIPYKLVTITAGFCHLDPVVFTIASLGSRALRFFLVAGLLWKFGSPIRDFIERRLTLVTTTAAALLVGGFLIVKYI